MTVLEVAISVAAEICSRLSLTVGTNGESTWNSTVFATAYVALRSSKATSRRPITFATPSSTSLLFLFSLSSFMFLFADDLHSYSLSRFIHIQWNTDTEWNIKCISEIITHHSRCIFAYNYISQLP